MHRPALPLLLAIGVCLAVPTACKKTPPPILNSEAAEPEPPPPPGLPPNSVADARNAGYSNPSEIQFWRAITNNSTAHSLVVISVTNKNGSTATFCVDSRSLLGAIHTEFDLKYDNSGEKKAIQIAMHMYNNGFIFNNNLALSNIKPTYSLSDLDWAIGAISKYTNQEILSKFDKHDIYDFETKILQNKPKSNGRLQFAIAHAVYIRGLNVGRGCATSNLWVSE